MSDSTKGFHGLTHPVIEDDLGDPWVKGAHVPKAPQSFYLLISHHGEKLKSCKYMNKWTCCHFFPFKHLNYPYGRGRWAGQNGKMEYAVCPTTEFQYPPPEWPSIGGLKFQRWEKSNRPLLLWKIDHCHQFWLLKITQISRVSQLKYCISSPPFHLKFSR